jgi:hypothetical protein
MKRRTHGILGAFAGFLLGLGLSLVLLVTATIPLDSILLVILPIALLVLGAVWGKIAPIGRGGASSSSSAPAASS